MSNLSTLPKGDSAWLLRKAIERIMEQVSVLETNIGSSTTGNSLDGQIIFNDNGTLRGDTGLTYAKSTTTLRAGLLIVPGNTQLATVGILYVGTTANPRLKVDVGANLTTITNATITGALTVDTTTLVVDSTNDRVGIGTATPNYILDILGATPRIHLKDNGTGSSLVDIENGAGTLYVGRENSTGSGGLSGVPYAGILYLQGAYPLIFGTNLIERYRIDSTGISTWSVAGSTAMTLNSTGLVIGSASAVGKFSVYEVAGDTNIFIRTATTSKGQIVFQDNGDLANPGKIKYDHSNDQLSFTANGGENLYLLSTGDLSLTTGNVVVSNGKGIDFSATSGTGTSELLNDYEEGTWTATLKGATTDPTTAVTATGQYTKVGRQVSVQVYIANVITTGASGRIFITGLPFSNTSTTVAIGTTAFYDIATFTGSPFGELAANGTTVEMYSSVSNSAYQPVTHNAGINRYLYLNLTYTV